MMKSPGAHSEVSVYKLEGGLSLGNEYTGTLVFDSLASRLVRNKYLLFNLFSFWNLIVSAQGN